MSSSDFIIIKTDEDWQKVKDQAAEENKNILLAKLSPACPISHMAESELRQWHAKSDLENTLFVEVDVIRARNLARGIAKEVEVEHQSPQIIYFDSQTNPLWNESHQSISSIFLDSKLS